MDRNRDLAQGLSRIENKVAASNSDKFKAVRVTPVSFIGDPGTDQVVFNLTEIPNAIFESGGAALLKSITLIDYDDNSADSLDLYFFEKNTNTDMGTLGAVIDITDPELLANGALGWVTIGAVADNAIGDAILSRIHTLTDVNLMVKSGVGSKSIYVAGVTQAGRTSTASGNEFVFGFERV
jgi:hypothetical protein|tara:strand:- start:538 stop:1080 length:543 start_codon:yes stop_codon:yes gene_type:complete